NAALTGWPMLYGASAMATLWALTRWLAIWPSGFRIPYVWPATLGASLVMWTQALVWLPYGLRGLRVVVAVFVLWIIDAIVILALHFDSAEWVVIAITAPQIPVAYAVGRVALARARRGVVPDWGFPTSAARGSHRPSTIDHRRGQSASAAQRWYEWRRHGRALPGWVAIILPLELLLLWTVGTSTSLAIEIILGALITPVI